MNLVGFLVRTLRTVVYLYLGLAVLLMYVLNFAPELLMAAAYLSFAKLPLFFDMRDPTLHGVLGARRFFVYGRDHDIRPWVNTDPISELERVSCWHLLPKNHHTIGHLKLRREHLQTFDNGTQILREEFFADEHEYMLETLRADGLLKGTEDKEVPLVLYLHGNGATRAFGHRLEFYDVLRTHLGAHVVAMDYRGFAESSGGVPEDHSRVVVDAVWVWDRLTLDYGVEPRRIIVWGHSLGAGIATEFMQVLLKRIKDYDTSKQHHVPSLPKAVVLEAAFTSLLGGASSHFLSLPVRIMPYMWDRLQEVFPDGFYNLKNMAETDLALQVPILLQHGEYDTEISFDQSQEIHAAALATQERSVMAKTDLPPLQLSFYATGGHNNLMHQTHFCADVHDFLLKVEAWEERTEANIQKGSK
eukprot:Clim_evm15s217 gene=Clim_evmTU15s217